MSILGKSLIYLLPTYSPVQFGGSLKLGARIFLVSKLLKLFYQKFEVIQHEYRKGIREAVRKTEVGKEQKAFHPSQFFFFLWNCPLTAKYLPNVTAVFFLNICREI